MSRTGSCRLFRPKALSSEKRSLEPACGRVVWKVAHCKKEYLERFWNPLNGQKGGSLVVWKEMRRHQEGESERISEVGRIA